MSQLDFKNGLYCTFAREHCVHLGAQRHHKPSLMSQADQTTKTMNACNELLHMTRSRRCANLPDGMATPGTRAGWLSKMDFTATWQQLSILCCIILLLQVQSN